MTCTQTATCQSCGWHGPVEHTKELRDVLARVQPGDVMPAGECPQEGCHSAAMLDERPRHPPTGPRLQPVCNACGSTGVLVDAWASWDIDSRRWELHSTYEPAAICTECDTECSYSMKPVPVIG